MKSIKGYRIVSKYLSFNFNNGNINEFLSCIGCEGHTIYYLVKSYALIKNVRYTKETILTTDT